jgi:hypothetical protein
MAHKLLITSLTCTSTSGFNWQQAVVQMGMFDLNSGQETDGNKRGSRSLAHASTKSDLQEV